MSSQPRRKSPAGTICSIASSTCAVAPERCPVAWPHDANDAGPRSCDGFRCPAGFSIGGPHQVLSPPSADLPSPPSQVRQATKTKLLVDFQHLIRAKAGDAQHLQSTGRDFLTHRLQAGMIPVLCSLVMMSAIASPTPGISVSLPSATKSSSGSVSARRFWPRECKPWNDMGCPRATLCVGRIPAAGERLQRQEGVASKETRVHPDNVRHQL